jgi:hypothetical protein
MNVLRQDEWHLHNLVVVEDINNDLRGVAARTGHDNA